MMHTMRYESPIGEVLLAEKDDSLVGLWMKGQKHYSETLGNEPREDTESGVLLQAKEWLNRYFAGEKPTIQELPLAPVGSSFRKEVWSLLSAVLMESSQLMVEYPGNSQDSAVFLMCLHRLSVAPQHTISFASSFHVIGLDPTIV